MKKLYALALILVLTLAACTALAVSGEQGDTAVNVSFTVESPEGVYACFHISYSDAALEFVSATGGASNPSAGSGNFVFGDNANTIGKKTGNTITFKIRKDAVPGSYSFSVDSMECRDINGDPAECIVNVEALSVTECVHATTSWIETVPATCVDAGVKELTCVKCGHVVTTAPIDPLNPSGHTEVTDPAVEADCTHDGLSEGIHCSACGAVIKAQDTVSALGHDYHDGVCSRCGALDPSFGYLYSITGTEASITKYRGSSASVTVPSSLGGATVTGIDSGAFPSSVKDVYISRLITSIGDNAFATGTVIHCYSSSYAKTWANDHGYTVVPMDPTKDVEISVDTVIYMDIDTTLPTPFSMFPVDDYDCVYTSSDESVVTVDKKGGKLVAVGTGSATVTLTIGSESKSTTVRVREPLISFSLDKSEIYLIVGETYTFTLTDKEPAAATPVITWTSSDGTFAEVSSSGVVTAKTAGDALIRATDLSGVWAQCRVHVTEDVTEVKFKESTCTCEENLTVQLTAEVKVGEDTLENRLVTFSSSDTGVATVDENGLVTAVSAGTATVTAAAANGKSDSCTVTVTAHGHTVLVTKAAKAPTCTEDGWTEETVCSDCKQILSASVAVPKLGHDGTSLPAEKENVVNATCVKQGSYDEVHYCARCGVEVSRVPQTTAALGHHYISEPKIPETCTSVGYTETEYCDRCYDVKKERTEIPMKEHVPVYVPALSPTYTTEGNTEGHKCSVCNTVLDGCEVIPKKERPAVEEVTLTPAGPAVMEVSNSLTVIVAVAPADADATVTWTSSNPAIAKVDNTGKVTALALGTVTITAKAVNGKTAALEITVNEPTQVAYIILDAGEKITVHQDDDFTLTYKFDPSSATSEVTFTSEKPSVVKVNEDGSLTALKGGITKVTATTANGKTDTIEVTVHACTIIPAVAPTCTEEGATQGRKCNTEGCTFIEELPAPIPAAGHSGQLIPSQAATCQAPGHGTGIECSVCGKVLVTPVVTPQLPHTEVTDIAKSPSCTETGLTEGKHCSVCDTVIVAQQVVPMLPHTESAPVIENHIDSTCTKAGSEEEVIYCSVCTAEVSRTKKPLEVLPHTESIVPGYAADCKTPGLTDGIVCSVCSSVLQPQNVIPALGHTNGTPVIENHVNATCAAEGSEEQVIYCTVCGDEVSRTPVTLPKLEHTEVTIPGYPATATTTGLTDGKKCAICNEILVPQQVIPIGGGRLPGDVNNDGTVDGRDSLRLLQYLAGWGVTINDANSDVNGSGSVNGLDSMRLMQYLAGWGVTLQ